MAETTKTRLTGAVSALSPRFIVSHLKPRTAFSQRRQSEQPWSIQFLWLAFDEVKEFSSDGIAGICFGWIARLSSLLNGGQCHFQGTSFFIARRAPEALCLEHSGQDIVKSIVKACHSGILGRNAPTHKGIVSPGVLMRGPTSEVLP